MLPGQLFFTHENAGRAEYIGRASPGLACAQAMPRQILRFCARRRQLICTSKLSRYTDKNNDISPATMPDVTRKYIYSQLVFCFDITIAIIHFSHTSFS